MTPSRRTDAGAFNSIAALGGSVRQGAVRPGRSALARGVQREAVGIGRFQDDQPNALPFLFAALGRDPWRGRGGHCRDRRRVVASDQQPDHVRVRRVDARKRYGLVVEACLESLLLLVCLLLSTAAFIYLERKIWGSVQLRRGPNVVGPWGALQVFADFLKFMLKEPIIPASANKGVFVLAPLVSVVLALSAWAVMPVADGWSISDINVGILYLFAVSSLGVYGIVMAGWASNSKYALLSALRAAAQMVSYEVSIGFVIVTVVMCAGSLNLSDIVRAQDTRFGLFGWYWLPLLPMFIIFFVSALAETNRPPFDLTEAELELVAGYSVEYSASLFLLQFLTELVAVLTMSAMTAVLFLGGWLSPLPFPPFTWVPGLSGFS